MAGVPVDLATLHAGRGSDPARWNDPPRRPGWIVNGHCARSATGDPLPNGVHPAHEAPAITLSPPGAPAPQPAAAAAAGTPPNGGLGPNEIAVVTEYLRIVQGMVSAGSDIVRGHVTTNGH